MKKAIFCLAILLGISACSESTEEAVDTNADEVAADAEAAAEGMAEEAADAAEGAVDAAEEAMEEAAAEADDGYTARPVATDDVEDEMDIGLPGTNGLPGGTNGDCARPVAC